MKKVSTLSPIIVAIDTEINDAKRLIETLNPALCRLKVGKGLFTQMGPAIVEHMHKKGFEVFLDLKFHDIPNTVAHAVLSAANLGVWMVNVHASGGEKMLRAAREAIDNLPDSQNKPLLIAVTLLTSLSAKEIAAIGYQGTPESIVQQMANTSKNAGLDGIVCSAQEANMIATLCGKDFISVCPGIRPLSHTPGSDDQTRIMSPRNALAAGAHYLVIGRPITQAPDPNQALENIYQSL